MQRASPTRMTPIINSGLSGNSTMASRNITKGPTIQFWINDKLNNLRLLKTTGNSSYLTFASGGYIIKIKPIAIGILVVPELNESQKPAIPGKA